MVLYRQGNELVDIILGLTSRSLDSHIVRRGLEVFFAAAIRMLSPFHYIVVTRYSLGS